MNDFMTSLEIFANGVGLAGVDLPTPGMHMIQTLQTLAAQASGAAPEDAGLRAPELAESRTSVLG